jgi:1-acyl-sn-glycerol-3-phosphate acyltransferase
MPLPPLPDPTDPATRLAGVARALPTAGLLAATLLAFNAAQTASLVVRPASKTAFRRFNRWAADTWWGWCVVAANRLYHVHSALSGDELPSQENAIVLANHQQMTDVPFLMALARSKQRLGDLKWLVKDPVKYVPGIGWGMWFLDCPFLKRDWAEDRASIERTFQNFLRDQIPLWLVSFPEGTRLTSQKLAASRQYAIDHSMQPLDHLLVPRTKGFVASVHGLRSHVRAVYDITIGYERGVPTLWQYTKGYCRRAHLHLRRYPIESIPEQDEQLANWLIDRYREKDALLDRFYRDGTFV